MKRFIGAVCCLVTMALGVQHVRAVEKTWVYSVQAEASVQVSPPRVTLSWPQESSINSYTVHRKAVGATSWGTGTSLPGSATTYTDSNVATGVLYEYQIVKTSTLGYTGYGYVCTGIEVPFVEDRGRVILVVDNTHAAGLASELNRLRQDLVGDGWTVIRKDVTRTATPAQVKSLIKAEYDANPASVKAVLLFGRIPVLRSGNLNVDGHQSRPMPADAFYGDMDGNWTDSNGDGIYDQSRIPSDIELQVGRVDFANMPGQGAASPYPGEAELLRRYLGKNHNFRHAVVRPANRGLVGNRFGDFGGEAFAASGYRNFAPFFGAANTLTANTDDGSPIAERWISRLAANDYLWAYGCGGGSSVSMSGLGTHGAYSDVWAMDLVDQNAKAMFYMMFGSWLGDWDQPDNIMRAGLAAKDYGLTCSWAGRPHHFYHHMGMGGTVGYGIRLSQNNSGLYRNQVNGETRGVHVALMGDPTLRMHIVAPPSGLQGVIGSTGAILNWNASPDPVLGYHVYRSANPDGPFTRVTSSLISSLGFTDTSVTLGTHTYMVRAVKLEHTPSGSYHNLSQGIHATLILGGDPPPPSDTSAPSVSITSPASGATVSGTSVSISANATDDVGVSGVQFRLNGANLGAEDTTTPYSVVWNTTPLPDGTHTLTAVARDAAGNQSTSSSVNVIVNNDTSGDFSETVWVDDALPSGAWSAGEGGDGWNWITSNPTPVSGTRAHQSNLAAGQHGHYFDWATSTLAVAAGDILFAYIHLDPANMPEEVMLMWNDGTWEHRAYWGANRITYGANDSPGRRYMGPLPSGGQWVRLEVPASQVDLEGSTVRGMAFYLYGGRATWDKAGKSTQNTPTQPDGLPSPWLHRDVGAVGLTGNASHDGTSFSVTGSGTDIWGTVDGFHFVYQSWTGDGQIIARVTGVQNTDPWAKSGVMIRQSLDAGAANAFLMLTPGNGPGFQSRANMGGPTSYAPGRWATSPHWLKLTRSGNVITGSTSTDGANWTVVSSQTLSMSGSILVGLAVTSHNNSTANTSSFDNVRVSAAAATTSAPGVVASSADAPRLDSPTRDEAGGISLTLHGETGRTYAVMSSQDLVHWTPLFNRPNPDGTITFTDSDAANHPHRFYRAVGAL